VKVGRRDFLKGGGMAALLMLLRGKKTLEEFVDEVDEQVEEYVEEELEPTDVTSSVNWDMGSCINVTGWFSEPFITPEKNPQEEMNCLGIRTKHKYDPNSGLVKSISNPLHKSSQKRVKRENTS